MFDSRVDVASAGVRPAVQVDPRAVEAMAEVGISIASHKPKTVADLSDNPPFALVVTVCSRAADDCPTLRGARKVMHVPFEDPPALAAADGAQDPMPFYRAVRDEIKAFVETLPTFVPELRQDEEQGRSMGLSPASAIAGAVASGPAPAEAPLNAGDGELLPQGDVKAPPAAPARDAMGIFERYLTVWVLLCMVIGGLIGYFAPSVAEGLARAEFARISAPVTVLLWLMIFPMLVQIDFSSILRLREQPGALALTTTINFAVQPFTMYAVALLFFRIVYASLLEAPLADQYIAGCVLLGGAPCTAMVFVWSLLVGGNGAYTLMQVALNDLIMLALYIPTAMLLLGVSSIPLPYDTIALAVALFIAAPLVLAVACRALAIRHRGEAWLRDVLVARFKPVTMVALLLTLILIFIFQGRTIGEKPLHIVLIAVPLILQTLLIFALAYSVGYATCIAHPLLAPASLVATSNFFELAVAVAISLYGLDSGAALATVVGVLVEVPVMLCLVRVCMWLRPALDRRVAACECKALRCRPQCAALRVSA